MTDGPVVGSESTAGPEVPSHLTVRPRVRYVWCAGFGGLGLALMGFGIGTLRSSSTPWWVPVLLLGLGVPTLAMGVMGLRWSIVADQDAVTITNYLRPAIIPWADLDDVLLVKVEGSEIDLGFHYMLFRTRDGRTIRPAAPTGWNKPGRTLPRLQHDLLAMRNRYAPRPP
jgi:hypothetical protein